jgi:hypothetical protein
MLAEFDGKSVDTTWKAEKEIRFYKRVFEKT